MKECFIPKQFGPRAREFITQANEIIGEYQTQGYCMTVRQLYYQFVARNILKNTPQNYEAVQAVVSEARLAGEIDWSAIEDRARVTRQTPTFASMKSYLERLNDDYRRDKWENQPNHVEVMVEKQALEGVLLPICEKWDAPFTATKGYSSSSTLYDRGKFLQSMRDVEGKSVHVLYLGDHDPSGMDMSRDIQDRLRMFSDGYVTVHRIALNIDQVQRHNLPENPAKLKDSRAEAYIKEFGTSSWELDALDPATLASLVEHGIRGLVDLKQWNKDEEIQFNEQSKLQDIVEKMT